jgi:hypothetical protein
MKKADCADYVIGIAIAVFAAVIVAWSSDAKATEKVEICHRTYDGGSVTIEVAPAAVEAHLAHGDYLGECEDGDSDTDSDTDTDSDVDTGDPVQPAPHQVPVLGNPVEMFLEWIEK